MFYFLTKFYTDCHLYIIQCIIMLVTNITVEIAEVCLILGYLRERNAGEYLCVLESTSRRLRDE